MNNGNELSEGEIVDSDDDATSSGRNLRSAQPAPSEAVSIDIPTPNLYDRLSPFKFSDEEGTVDEHYFRRIGNEGRLDSVADESCSSVSSTSGSMSAGSGSSGSEYEFVERAVVSHEENLNHSCTASNASSKCGAVFPEKSPSNDDELVSCGPPCEVNVSSSPQRSRASSVARSGSNNNACRRSSSGNSSVAVRHAEECAKSQRIPRNFRRHRNSSVSSSSSDDELQGSDSGSSTDSSSSSSSSCSTCRSSSSSSRSTKLGSRVSSASEAKSSASEAKSSASEAKVVVAAEQQLENHEPANQECAGDRATSIGCAEEEPQKESDRAITPSVVPEPGTAEPQQCFLDDDLIDDVFAAPTYKSESDEIPVEVSMAAKDPVLPSCPVVGEPFSGPRYENRDINKVPKHDREISKKDNPPGSRATRRYVDLRGGGLARCARKRRQSSARRRDWSFRRKARARLSRNDQRGPRSRSRSRRRTPRRYRGSFRRRSRSPRRRKRRRRRQSEARLPVVEAGAIVARQIWYVPPALVQKEGKSRAAYVAIPPPPPPVPVYAIWQE